MAGLMGAMGGGAGAGAAGSAAGGASGSGMAGMLGGMLGGMGGGKGESGGGADPTKASMMGFQVPSMSGIGLEAVKNGNANMLAAAQGGNTPVQATSQSNMGSDLATKLMDKLQAGITNSLQPTPQSASEPSLNSSGPNFMNPLNKKQLNLGNQASQLDSLKNFKY